MELNQYYIINCMIKSKYVLSQMGGCCNSPGNFAIHELPHEDPRKQQESGFSQLDFSPQTDVGKFEERETSPFCFSCQRINKLRLELYGQQLSLAESQGNCFCHSCSGELTVYSHSRLILGKIRKTCSAWCSSNVMQVEDENQKEVFTIRMKCCQLANFLPRPLLCGAELDYEIIRIGGEVVATLKKVYRGWRTSLLTLQDDYHIHFLSVDKEKEKILLLNAVVFLNHMRHEWF